jgi:hypothetical protein
LAAYQTEDCQMTPRSKTLLLMIILCLIAISTGWTEEQSKQTLMHEKLLLVQQMFTSLAKEDYVSMEKQAMKLGELTHEAAWLVHSTPEYQRESVEFERSTYMLAEAAKEKNLGATTLGFLNVNMSCASCHQYLRDAHQVEIKNVRELPQPKIDADVEDANFWMAKKLQLSNQIVAALAVGDFETISHNAEAIDLLSRVEGWARRKDVKLYRAHLESFRTANDDLRRHAKDKHLPGATLAFSQVTLSCVKCHHQLRSEQTSKP